MGTLPILPNQSLKKFTQPNIQQISEISNKYNNSSFHQLASFSSAKEVFDTVRKLHTLQIKKELKLIVYKEISSTYALKDIINTPIRHKYSFPSIKRKPV